MREGFWREPISAGRFVAALTLAVKLTGHLWHHLRAENLQSDKNGLEV